MTAWVMSQKILVSKWLILLPSVYLFLSLICIICCLPASYKKHGSRYIKLWSQNISMFFLSFTKLPLCSGDCYDAINCAWLLHVHRKYLCWRFIKHFESSAWEILREMLNKRFFRYYMHSDVYSRFRYKTL